MGGGTGGAVTPPAPTSTAEVTSNAKMLAEIRARQERARRGVTTLMIAPTSTVQPETGLRIPQ